MMSREVFSRILVAKHSPSNGCFAREGDILSIRPRETIPKKDHVQHFFVSTSDLKTKSKYGWITAVRPFTLPDFVRKHLQGASLSAAEESHIHTMLTSIEKLPEGTAVTAT